MTILKELLEIESAPPRSPDDVLAETLEEMGEQAVDGICPYWQDCHARRGHISDEYQCNWRKLHRVALCGTYKSRQREG